MSKSIVMSVIASLALSLGGWLASCGTSRGSDPSTLVVQVPDGCFLVSPKDQYGGISGGPSVISVPTGRQHFVMDCDGRQVEVEKEIKPNERMVRFSSDDLH